VKHNERGDSLSRGRDYQRACGEALRNVFRFLRPSASLPDNVYEGAWSRFLFFESDQIFFGPFAEAVKTLLTLRAQLRRALSI
jgi:hypothetical protein